MTTLNSRRRGGFTLIELLLVLVILGTLAAIVVPQLAGTGKEAKITATKATIRNIENALDRFEQHNDGFPTTDEGIAALIAQPQDRKNWKGPYLKALPKDAWQNELMYVSPGENNTKTYDIWSVGPDGKDGTGDEITNWVTGEESK